MKYIYIIILILFLTGCTQYVEVPVIETVVETVIVAETEYIEDTDKIDKLQEELDSYKELISNLGEYLGYVYYVYQLKSDGSSSWGTGFSIEYENEFYFITAGHIVDNKYGYFPDLGFQLKDNWVYPELITYSNDYINKEDYAIFSSEIDKGFKVDLDNDNPLYKIGDTILDYKITSIEGESGSPVIDVDGEVTEIATTDMYFYNTDIDMILETIDNLE